MRPPVLRLAKSAIFTGQKRSFSSPQTQLQPAHLRHLMSIKDLSPEELTTLVRNAAAHKRLIKKGKKTIPLSMSADEKKEFKRAVKQGRDPKTLRTSLTGGTVAMLFNKLSTRTRVSTEAAVAIMGGHPMFLGKNDIQLGVNESLYDTSKVISSMTDCIVARVGPHSDVMELAKYSSVPVINALSDDFHPLQIIADFLTIYEVYPHNHGDGIFPPDLKIAWVGDANNVLFDLAIGCVKVGAHIAVATPHGYGIPADMAALIRAESQFPGARGKFSQHFAPEEAVQHADIIVTDTWVSMGQEDEARKKIRDFEGFQVTEELAKRGGARPGWKFMHCLPRHAEEVSDEVFHSQRSLVFREAQNRLFAAVAVLEAFVVKKGKILIADPAEWVGEDGE